MANKPPRGRVKPTPPQPYPGSSAVVSEWAYPWNVPRQAIASPYTFEEYERPPTDEQLQALVCAQELLSQQPMMVQRGIRAHLNKLEETQGIKRANTYLTKDFVERVLPRLEPVANQYRITSHSLDSSLLVARFNKLPDSGKSDDELLAKDIAQLVKHELSIVNDEITGKSELTAGIQLYKRAGALTQKFRQTPPGWGMLQTDPDKFTADRIASFLARMLSEKWWLRRLRRWRDMWREHLHIALGNVSKKASPYASTGSVSDWREQKRRTREFLKSMELEDEAGNRISLIGKYDHSIANPAIRRCELMARIRGFENICNALGYVGEFYTITAPSRFHATTKDGRNNGKWQGASPAETQQYLRGVWSRIRAKLHREDVRIFGIRVAEPHHDGTPHWHMLIFMLPEDVDFVRRTAARYASKEDAHELNNDQARKARFHAEAIDPDKGSATGYIAKYISKNIDGYALDDEIDDDTDRPLKEVAPAVSAWANRWRIRQFQFIGGAPVTVYRELRRMADHDAAMGLSVEFAAVHDAADHGQWAEYVNAQGGPFVRRDDLIARTYYEISETTNDYFEDVIRIRGLFSPPVGMDTPIITRTTEWKIVPARAVDLAVALGGASAPPRSSVNNCTGEQKSSSKPPPVPPPVIPAGADLNQMTPKQRRRLLKCLREQSVKTKKSAATPCKAARSGRSRLSGLSDRELKIKDFAHSIGIEMDAGMLRSVARGAQLTTGAESWRAGEDGALYLIQKSTSPNQVLQRFENLRRRQESAVKRQVREHLQKEEENQAADNADRPVWFGPTAG